jgi:hypothetical protein
MRAHLSKRCDTDSGLIRFLKRVSQSAVLRELTLPKRGGAHRGNMASVPKLLIQFLSKRGTNLDGSRLASDKRVCCAHAEIHCSMSCCGAVRGGAKGVPASSSSAHALSFMLYIWRMSSRRWLRTTYAMYPTAFAAQPWVTLRRA